MKERERSREEKREREREKRRQREKERELWSARERASERERVRLAERWKRGIKQAANTNSVRPVFLQASGEVNKQILAFKTAPRLLLCPRVLPTLFFSFSSHSPSLANLSSPPLAWLHFQYSLSLSPSLSLSLSVSVSLSLFSLFVSFCLSLPLSLPNSSLTFER